MTSHHGSTRSPLTVALAILFASCGGGGGGGSATPTPPSAAFSASPTGTGVAGVTTFTFVAGGVSSASASWDFGDGTTGSGSTVTHVYGREGTFRVVLTVGGAATATTADAHVAVRTLSGTWSSLPVSGVWHELRVIQQGTELAGDWTVYIEPGSPWYTPGGSNLETSPLHGTVASPRVIALSQSGECRRAITNGTANESLTQMGGGSASYGSSACGGGASGFTGWQFYRTPPTALPTAASAKTYLDQILNVMQVNSINRAKIDWSDFRSRVIARAQGAQSIADLYPAISLALGLLGDHHSFYQAAPGSGGVGNPNGRYCTAPATASPSIPADIGYVRITEFGYTQPGSDVAFADQVENQIRSRDAAGLPGWIVDLRGNGGGDMWPMIAGVGSVLGDGVAGYFVPPLEGPSIPWGYRNGASFSGDSIAVRTSHPYVLIAPAPRVAVLTDAAVASSGEAVVVAFRARPHTHSFGGATCGLSTSNEGFRLTDGATLLLTTSVMADRTLASYGESIAPDETVAGDAEVVARAIAWLRSTAD